MMNCSVRIPIHLTSIIVCPLSLQYLPINYSNDSNGSNDANKTCNDIIHSNDMYNISYITNNDIIKTAY